MPRAYACPRCGTPSPAPGLCPSHQALELQRRRAKAKEQGHNSASWARVRQEVRARDGRCLRCGTSEDLTVHLDPHLQGNHHLATPSDAITLCRSCHGSVDAPRAKRGGIGR